MFRAVASWVKLALPPSAKLHNVFHVGLLKPFRGEHPTAAGILPPIRHGRACLTPDAVVKSRLARGQRELPVHWMGQPAADATWMG